MAAWGGLPSDLTGPAGSAFLLTVADFAGDRSLAFSDAGNCSFKWSPPQVFVLIPTFIHNNTLQN
jgi:hypothetical protein